MRNILVVLFALLLVVSCDDGDIITVNIDFDDIALELCENDVSNYILYKTKSDPAESISLIFPRIVANDLIFSPEVSPYERSFDLDGNNVFNYRTYNQEPEFCTSIPNSNIIIQEDYESEGGTVNIVTEFIDSDDDGIPNEDEDDNLDGDNNYLTNPLDTDGDGLPNYIDQDDDNDNVLTKDEDDDSDGDGNPSTQIRDTDADGIADYLEEDDDNDGTLSRLEDENENRNPADDFLTDTDILPRYRNPDTNQEFLAPNPEFRVVSYTRTITSTFTIVNLGLEIISSGVFNIGSYTTTETFTYDNN